MFSKRNFISFVALLSLTSLILACGSTETVEVVKEVEVIKEVPVEKIVTEEKVVEKTVEVEKVVEVAAPEEDTVDLTWGKKKIEGVFGLRWQGPYRTSAIIDMQGVEEPLFIYKNGTPMEPYTAESWDVSADGKYLNIKIKDGINFNSPKGFETVEFGEFDATDVCWYFNNANPSVNAESTDPNGGDYAAVFGECEVVDSHTLKWELVSPLYFCFPISDFGCLSARMGPQSKKSYDKMGYEWSKSHHVGTGPYIQGACIAGDRCTIHKAGDTHWSGNAGSVDSITQIQVPEVQTRIAMLENGTLDMADMDFKMVPSLLDKGLDFVETMPGSYVNQSIIWSGNLWEEVHARTGEALNPWDAPSYAKDYPWIGDPWQTVYPDKVKYTDTDNPAGMSDMEQARLVRLALSVAIDRNAINKNILNDLGLPIYSEYMGPEYPGWDANRESGCWDVGDIGKGTAAAAPPTKRACVGTEAIMGDGVPWELPNGGGDLALAGELLDKAGYPAGSDGKRAGFGNELVLQSYVAETGEVSLEVADTVMSTWTQLGLEISGLEEDYGGVISPRMRRREQLLPVLKNGDVHSNSYPLDWPLPTVDSSSSRPGWGPGFESPAQAYWLFQILPEKDPAKRGEMHLMGVDYSMFWQQYGGIYMIPKGVVGQSGITWDGWISHYANTSAPQFIDVPSGYSGAGAAYVK
ncbi:MAG: ABC transporter substrate-binding protein [Chloroflexota bacterium]|nr:ABC transporter substrate-binding protein [Chloroflexota bacterium]